MKRWTVTERRCKRKAVSMTSPACLEFRLPMSSGYERTPKSIGPRFSNPKAEKCMKMIRWNNCRFSLRQPTWLFHHNLLKLRGSKSQPNGACNSIVSGHSLVTFPGYKRKAVRSFPICQSQAGLFFTHWNVSRRHDMTRATTNY